MTLPIGRRFAITIALVGLLALTPTLVLGSGSGSPTPLAPGTPTPSAGAVDRAPVHVSGPQALHRN